MAHMLEAPAAATLDRARGAQDWDGLIVLCAANNWDAVKLADRHMAERLTAHAPVLYVDPADLAPDAFKNPAVAASSARPAPADRRARHRPLHADRGAEADRTRR